MNHPLLRKKRGFANPEPLLFLCFIGIILAILIPQIARFRERKRNFEALRQVRTALDQYAVATHTKGPPLLEQLTLDGKYLKELPAVSVMGRHNPSAMVSEIVDNGGWAYDRKPGSPTEGRVWINCTHTDSKGKSWSDY